jgi:hypothetical protein
VDDAVVVRGRESLTEWESEIEKSVGVESVVGDLLIERGPVDR